MISELLPNLILAQETSSSGGSSFLVTLLPIAFLVGLFWLLLIRPQRKRAAAQQAMQSKLGIGDEVETIGGIQGLVMQIHPDTNTVTLDLDSGSLRITRRAIAAVLNQTEEEEGITDEGDSLPEGSDQSDSDKF